MRPSIYRYGPLLIDAGISIYRCGHLFIDKTKATTHKTKLLPNPTQSNPIQPIISIGRPVGLCHSGACPEGRSLLSSVSYLASSVRGPNPVPSLHDLVFVVFRSCVSSSSSSFSCSCQPSSSPSLHPCGFPNDSKSGRPGGGPLPRWHRPP